MEEIIEPNEKFERAVKHHYSHHNPGKSLPECAKNTIVWFQYVYNSDSSSDDSESESIDSEKSLKSFSDREKS